MKTALTQLIEKLTSRLGELAENMVTHNEVQRMVELSRTIKLAEGMLEAEKEQIMEAYDGGYSNDSEQYYQQTYKSDE